MDADFADSEEKSALLSVNQRPDLISDKVYCNLVQLRGRYR